MRKKLMCCVLVVSLAWANGTAMRGQETDNRSEFNAPPAVSPPTSAVPDSFSPQQTSSPQSDEKSEVAVPAILGGQAQSPPSAPKNLSNDQTEFQTPQDNSIKVKSTAIPQVPKMRDATSLDNLRAGAVQASPIGEVESSANPNPSRAVGFQDRTANGNAVRTIPISSKTPASLKEPGYAILTEGPQLRVETIGPEQISIGKRSKYEFIVRNIGKQKADQVIVGIDIPEWIEIAQSQQSTGNREFNDQGTESRIVWNIPIVDPGSAEKLTLEVIPQQARPFDVAVDWTLRPIQGRTSIVVTQPQLSIQISGPDEVLYGETAIYNVSVANPGTGTAENVSVMLPEELGGQRARLGHVEPGEQKQFQVELLARAAGILELTTTAEADGGLAKSDSRNIMVRRASLEVAMAGPKMKFAGSTATYQITVSNSGDAMAKDVMAAVALPPGVTYVSGIDIAEKIEGGLRWNVGMLSPGNSRDYQLTCTVEQAGEANLEAATRGAGDLAAMTEFTTKVEAIADLVLSVSDPKGPLPVGADVTYEIRIKNRGTKNANDVKIVMQFGEGIEPNGAEGLNHNIEVGQVLFSPISQIAPNEEVALKVTAVSSQSGPIRFRAQLECEESGSYEVAEGTTRFFGEDASIEIESPPKDLSINDFRR